MGRATALAFARAGVQGLVLGDINTPGVKETAKQTEEVATNPKFAVTASHVDVRNWESVQAFFQGAVARFGRIDYSITTAGVSCLSSLKDMCLVDDTDFCLERKYCRQ